MVFKFSLISDMHVNHPQPKTPYDKLEKFVIVAGDTDNGLGGVKFLEKLKRKGHTVFAVDGNHEHYSNFSQGRDVEETETRFYSLLDQDYFLRLEEEKILIVGSNGWYRVENELLWQNYMNDSRCCSLSANHVNTLASQNTYRIKYHIKYHLERLPEGWKVIVVTHTSPCLETLNPQFKGHYSNDWYWNPLMRKVLSDYRDKILVWCHGHTHHPNEKIVDGVRVICNPRGYPGENPDWQPLTVKVENE